MEEYFTDVETSKQLRQLGFDEYCLAYWNDIPQLNFGYNHRNSHFHGENNPNSTAALWGEVIHYFANLNLFGKVDEVGEEGKWYVQIKLRGEPEILYNSLNENLNFKHYYEAQIFCVKKLIEIYNQKIEEGDYVDYSPENML